MAHLCPGLRREQAPWLQWADMGLDAGPHGTIRVRVKTIDGESWQPKTRVSRVVAVSSALRI